MSSVESATTVENSNQQQRDHKCILRKNFNFIVENTHVGPKCLLDSVAGQDQFKGIMLQDLGSRQASSQ